uniref:phenylalanine--tRNA ligase n=1 Tax=Odontella aurita TaxID=265563 RepID=A0A7S4IXX5_9STRA|mmetsp:Transcript_32193/g.96493  ORF Transcript_32193/g.96493 Transcript_32193/m.96493 type:complete len:656 (+) Transcript_32193:261-2228(+)|eukprot:CAMPEP_0113564538 /NCGR_PEP_ID=MMETSP0015_2-20120614/21678_1 /TAXON_ID=2838 /ORGANISM="Odontella" /LENGTH=655 /DNA_ID=CAMNT_0000466637 /DNA_START=143 /DNA_END=2110 /DNA_ORIENTATION=+ /assembly_acc=CAM_ASM_000160
MPTLPVQRDDLFAALGRTYTDDEFDELCFEFGVELDEITSEREDALKSDTVKLSREEISKLSDSVVYKIDVPANRYDLLCIEGLTRAIKVFLGDMHSPTYNVKAPAEPSDVNKMVVMESNTSTVRPYVVCAILRDITFNARRYQSFIELQDQLHRNLCRNRTLVAIGTHDMDAVAGPWKYDARNPDDIEFVPLTHDDSGASFTGRALLEHYEKDPSCKHLKPYVPIIKDSPLYPVVLDGNEVVLSLPPIINGARSKISVDTRNVFVECTATDLTKANIVLDTVVAMFSEYCADPFSVEPVTVSYVDESGTETSSYVTPRMYARRERAGVDFVNSLVGIDENPERMIELCDKLQLGPAALVLDEDTGKRMLEVTVPPTRSDILHPVDIAEDVGIAYGYNNIVKRVPVTSTVGGEQPLNKLGDLLRDEIGRAGYTEVLTHGLCSIRDNFTALRRDVAAAVSLLNPANVEYQVVRTTLLPGLLKTLQHNKSASFANGFKIFEISDVVLPDDGYTVTETAVGARNVRRLAAIYAGPTSGFEVVHGLVDRVMTLTEVAPERAYASNSGKTEEEKFRVSKEGWEYTIRPLSEAEEGERGGVAGTYFPGRAAEILLTKPGSDGGTTKKVRIGTFGIIHPEVLQNFDVQYPASCLELDLEQLM